MKLLIILLFISGICYGQDSLKLKITRVKTAEKNVYYWLTDIKTKDKYYTVCQCLPIRKKGELVTIVKRDMEFIPGKIKFQ